METSCFAGMAGSFLAGVVGTFCVGVVFLVVYALSQVDRAVPQDEPRGEA